MSLFFESRFKSRAWVLAGVIVAASSFAHSVDAQVVESSASSMQVKLTAQIAAPPEKVYRALTEIGKWWDPEHTYSQDSRNLWLDPHAGGCFCEALPGGGGVHHMTVVNVMPSKRIVLSGGLGPLQSAGVAGAMTWQLTPKNGGTEFSLVYNVGGYIPGGLAAIAGTVDGVLHAQVDRMKRYVETGNPVSPDNAK